MQSYILQSQELERGKAALGQQRAALEAEQAQVGGEGRQLEGCSCVGTARESNGGRLSSRIRAPSHPCTQQLPRPIQFPL